jgi:tetratricopeptide (TPR) repeat protein
MSVNYSEPHMNDPLFNSALKFLQQGDWDKGLVQLDQLILQYPLDHKLRAIRQEMQMRARMDQDEVQDLTIERRRRFTRFATRFWVLVLVVLLIVAGYGTVSNFISENIESARQTFEDEILVIEQSAKLRDAQALIRADRPEEALVLLEELVNEGAQFPELEPTIAQARGASSLLARYFEGLQQLQQENWISAQAIFEKILDEDPTFRDVPILLADMERYAFIDEILWTSNQHFDAGEWAEAVEGYESIRALDSEYQTQAIEDKLFSGYVNAAKASLVDQADSLQALEIAEKYFRKALALRPQDPDVKSERELAHLYLKAQNDFNQGLWGEVISGLEIINIERPDYALGTARQTLYEAYKSRGDVWMEKGDYELATEDYQRASLLASQDPEAKLRLYEAHLKIAEVEGTQGNFETAVFHYRTAIDLGDLRNTLLNGNAIQATAFAEAEKAAEEGGFSTAYEEYRRALGIIPGNACLSIGTYQEAVNIAIARERMVTHIVEAGEYLTMLANRYRSTVCAIVVANELSDPDVIILGQELLIPVLP